MFATFFRKKQDIAFEIETFWLSDGDFLECYWKQIENHCESTPIVIIFHGLAGSYQSSYIQGIVNTLAGNGFSSVVMHFRGSSGKANLLARSYHSGDSGDALEFITHLTNKYPNSKLFALGYSLGANMLLKLLGEVKELSPLKGAVAISAPMQLDICADSMNKGVSKIYQKRLLKDLNAALDKKYDLHDMQTLISLKRENIKNLKTFWDFDDVYTAPIHGFKSAQDYYSQCSSKQYLQWIQTPTLIIHAKDDPFMSPEVIPKADELSCSITLEVTPHGGHVGFVSGTLFKPIYWSESRVVEFFKKLV